MSLKKEILEKIPNYIKEEPEFKTLLEHVKAQEITKKEDLLIYLKKEITVMEKWMAENKGQGGTMVKSFRDKALRLGIFKKCEKLVGMFLF